MQTYRTKSLQHEISDNFYDNLRQLEWNDKLSVAASRMDVRNNRQLSPLVFCFDYPNIIHDYSLKFLMRQQCSFMKELDSFIQRAYESGLMIKWLKGKTNIVVEKSSTFQYIQAKFKQTTVLLLICFGMLLFAFFIFFIERNVANFCRAENPRRIWQFIEMMIDGQRHFLNYDLYYY